MHPIIDAVFNASQGAGKMGEEMGNSELVFTKAARTVSRWWGVACP